MALSSSGARRAAVPPPALTIWKPVTASVGPAAAAGRSRELKIVAKCLLSGGVEDSFHHRVSKICALTFFPHFCAFVFFLSSLSVQEASRTTGRL